MIRRILRWVLQLLLAFDQLAYVFLAGPKYIVLGGRLPESTITISAVVGRRSSEGARWAIFLEPIIDRLFELAGEEPGHCRRAASKRYLMNFLTGQA